MAAETSTATVATANASSLLRKLCRHWAHRFSVEFDDNHGTLALPQASCILDATPQVLTVRLDAEPGADMARLQQVVEEHLQRFAFQETLVFAWNEQN